MRKWTEAEALDYLFLDGAEKTGAKTIFKRDGWNGLKACSAMDFLRKLNYTFKMVKTDESKRKKKAQKSSNTGDPVAGIDICLGNYGVFGTTISNDGFCSGESLTANVRKIKRTRCA